MSTDRWRWRVLEGGDERQPDRLAGRGDVGRVAGQVDHPLVGDRLHEHVLAVGLAEYGVGMVARQAHLHGAGTALGAAQHVDAHVVGDAVEPRPERRASLEGADGTPRPDHGFLDGVLGLGAAAEHAVAEARELPAVRLDRPFELASVPGADRPVAAGRDSLGPRC